MIVEEGYHRQQDSEIREWEAKRQVRKKLNKEKER
jgi:hypothetical protein